MSTTILKKETPPRYSVYEDEIVRKMSREGHGASAISKVLGRRSPNSVTCRSIALGIQRNDHRRIHKIEDWKGKTIGTRIVVGVAPRAKKDGQWLMRCDCGAEEPVYVSILMKPKGARTCSACNRSLNGKDSPNWRGLGDFSATFFAHLKTQALRRGIAFDLTLQQINDVWMRQDEVCAVTGQKLEFRRGSRWGGGSGSIDRIDSRRGYHADNIQIVHIDVNFAKQQMSNDALVALARLIVAWADRP